VQCHIDLRSKNCDALVIDPGDDRDRILEVIHRHNLRFRHPPTPHTLITSEDCAASGGDRRGTFECKPTIWRLRTCDAAAGSAGNRREKVEINEFLRDERHLVRWGRSKRRLCHTPVIRRRRLTVYARTIRRDTRAQPSPRFSPGTRAWQALRGTLYSQEDLAHGLWVSFESKES